MANQIAIRDDKGNTVAFKNADGTAASITLNADGSLPASITSGDGAVTLAEGADVTEGTKSDAAWNGSDAAATVVSILKAIYTRLRGGQATMANSLPVVLASNQSAIPVTPTGAAHFGAGQVNISTALQVVGARATRRSVTVKNLDLTAKIYVGLDNTVATNTGMELKAGESMNIDTVTAVFAIASTGTVVTAFAETYD